MTAAPALAVTGLSAGYRRRPVIRDLTLAPIRPGGVTALVGPNGAGKSTLLRTLAGLMPASGSIRLGERELLGLPPAARAAEIGFMPQALPKRVALGVLETLIAALKAAPLAQPRPAAALRAEALAVLRRVGLAALAMEPLDRLSGGQRQLASLAQTLVRQPQVLLLDEPTSSLDLRHQVAVMALLSRLAAEGRIVIVVLHDLTLAARWSQRVVVLDRGRIAADGPPEAAISSELLAATYGVSARLERCSRGRPQIVVDGPLDGPAAP